jgi:nitroimidazol reductase NimA-like FMN-containing flavoprotein (pyridoxamine 5'-phosphate oxidase superfamily)
MRYIEIMMKSIRRKEKAITEKKEMQTIIHRAKYIVIAMSKDNMPYLATLSHGYDEDRNCIYFHCAKEGKKIDILRENSVIWGQALLDKGYIQGSCDHLYATAQFMGRVTLIDDFEEKKHGLEVMIKALENDPKKVMDRQLKPESIEGVQIGRIDLEYMSGKKSDKVIIST